MATRSSLELLLSDEIAPLFWPAKRTQSAWSGHIAFAHWLIHVARPELFVELGTHSGISYSAFCEAVKSSGLQTRCFAVDTWAGDKHAGFYPEDVFEEFRKFHDENFGSFSNILRTTFDEAVDGFGDKSVDVIHIDGLHTYEAVRHDFETWLPKLSDRAVALFHDTNERREDFGVWRLWSELKQRYPSFEFLHSHGLGVLCVGSHAPDEVMALCSLDAPDLITRIRDRFASISANWISTERLVQLEKTSANGIAIRDEKIKDLEARAEKLDNQIDRYGKELRENREEIKRIKAVLDDVYRSTSWRISAPMRLTKRVIHNYAKMLRPLVAPAGSRPLASEANRGAPGLRQNLDVGDTADPAFASLSQGPDKQIANEAEIAKDGSKLIAFYLPQYHRIPENSEWWGPGFTEWTNVAKAKPNFLGHHQPNIPRELGYYDLSYTDSIREQAELAGLYGIHGFCFYYYWFSGQRILEKPIYNFLESGVEINFCLCWANENWTRTWDGDTKSVLMEQKYADGDAEAFIDSLIDSFRDRRYVTIDGKPLLLVYRAQDIPDPKRWFGIWRERVLKHGFSGIHIAAVDFYDISNPEEVGADSLVEFPPHKFSGPQNKPTPLPVILNPNFAGGIIDYVKVIAQSAHRPAPPFKLFRGIMPSWDNTARRQDTPTIVMNARPDLYGAWLSYLRTYARSESPDESNRFIFINAWNEWGEGCYIEPDQRWGLSYLEQTLKSSYYEAASAAGTSLKDAREVLFRRVAAIQAAADSDGKAANGTLLSTNVSRPHRIAAELAAYRPASEFARKVSAALLKYPALHRVAKFGYTTMLRIRR